MSRIITKNRNPRLNEFGSDDLVLNTKTGDLFIKAKNKLFKITSRNQSQDISNEPVLNNFTVDNISKLDNITFNGGTTYALTKDSAAFTPISSNALLVSIDGVIQQGNFSVSGTNIVFNFSPTGSNTCDFIMHYGTGVAFTPADSSITKDKTDFISTSSSSGLQIKGDGTTDGTLQLNCSQNSHGVKIKSPAHSAGQSYTLT